MILKAYIHLHKNRSLPYTYGNDLFYKLLIRLHCLTKTSSGLNIYIPQHRINVIIHFTK